MKSKSAPADDAKKSVPAPRESSSVQFCLKRRKTSVILTIGGVSWRLELVNNSNTWETLPLMNDALL
jgi:hypothetical protein